MGLPPLFPVFVADRHGVSDESTPVFVLDPFEIVIDLRFYLLAVIFEDLEGRVVYGLRLSKVNVLNPRDSLWLTLNLNENPRPPLALTLLLGFGDTLSKRRVRSSTLSRSPLKNPYRT